VPARFIVERMGSGLPMLMNFGLPLLSGAVQSGVDTPDSWGTGFKMWMVPRAAPLVLLFGTARGSRSPLSRPLLMVARAAGAPSFPT